MKLLIINYMALPIPPVKGGAVEYLINEFLEDNEKKHLHDIVLYSIYDENAEREAQNYKYTEFKFIKIRGIFDKADRAVRHVINRMPSVYVGNTYISKVIRKEKNLNQYDAVILENAPEFALKIPNTFKRRLILHLHNDYLNNKTKNAEKIFNRLDEIYTISDTLGDAVKTIKNSDKVKTLYNGVDLAKFSPDKELESAARKKYNIKDDDFVIMYCGRIVPDKGVLELTKAFEKIEGDNLRLLIVGGTAYSEFRKNEYFQAVQSIADERVIFTGFIPFDSIQTLYNIADVGVIPSMCNDAFNLTVVEFCAYSVPLIISDRGAMKELVNDKCSVIAECDDNFVLNLENALKKMINNRDNLEQMGLEAKKVSEMFGIERYCKRFNELLNN